MDSAGFRQIRLTEPAAGVALFFLSCPTMTGSLTDAQNAQGASKV